MHLWETKHQYYWNEGCFHERGHHFRYDSFAAFLEDRGDADDDLNLVARWDWRDDTDDDENVITPGTGELSVFYVVQRKGFTQSCAVRVTAADEPAVRSFLAAKWEHMKALWAPCDQELRTPAEGPPTP
jgi:hypothetical protein